VIDRVDDGTLSIAEICRRAGEAADALRLTRPSYEQVRTLVHLHRSRRRTNGRGELALAIGVSFGARLTLKRPGR
jgi:hypothetical protein